MNEKQIGELIAALTLDEKASLMSGAAFWITKSVPHLGIDSMMLTDGPHGLRKQGGAADHLGLNKSLPATCFPPAATLASSWDQALLSEVGEALGAESAAADVSVLLGPGLNIKRNPLGGRNFEYFSEDPLLSGKLAAAMVRGIQSRGVSACPKHFAVNSQETRRMSVDEVVDERALREIYLEGFRIAIEEGLPHTLMTSYNKVNGTYANEHTHLLREILRGEWGFDGVVVSDWGGNNDRVAAVEAGSTLEMPSTSGVTDSEVAQAVREGRLAESVLDERVTELLRVLYSTQQHLGAPQPDVDDHHALAVRAAEESAVLLRNDGTLPLADPRTRVAVIGEFAATPRYQGAGSSLVNPHRLVSALAELRASELNVIGYAPGFNRLGSRSERKRSAALDLAAQSDVVLLFLGLDESAEAEGLDRAHMHLPKPQLELARDLLRTGTPVVVVLSGGSPVELPFAGQTAAILHGYLGGQGSGTAIARLLTGAANPSGRLAETYPLRYADSPSAPWFARAEATAEHRESIFVGYRYYDKAGVAVRYPFGFGLSYTSFEYSDLAASEADAHVTITNTGSRPGAEVAQFYVAHADDDFSATQELAAFAKVYLEPGESRVVEVSFGTHAFASYDVTEGEWTTVGRTYQVRAGSSSRDIRAQQPVTVSGSRPAALARGGSYRTGRVHGASAAEFESLLGSPLPSPDWPKGAALTRDSIIEQARWHGPLGALLALGLDGAKAILSAAGKPLEAQYVDFANALPFRSLERMSGGVVTPAMLDGILAAFNGRILAGLSHTANAARTKESR
ncbi:MAG: glycoside hydrolase family 3 C-terminal domain-containing protein [Ruaniaceae bacterium]|nr:glycoside hydrolase family 3 C-terminal domain-containing protein [Ruaniaceae bacterium]